MCSHPVHKSGCCSACPKLCPKLSMSQGFGNFIVSLEILQNYFKPFAFLVSWVPHFEAEWQRPLRNASDAGSGIDRLLGVWGLVELGLGLGGLGLASEPLAQTPAPVGWVRGQSPAPFSSCGNPPAKIEAWLETILISGFEASGGCGKGAPFCGFEGHWKPCPPTSVQETDTHRHANQTEPKKTTSLPKMSAPTAKPFDGQQPMTFPMVSACHFLCRPKICQYPVRFPGNKGQSK